jgi:hypothetical protein
VARWFYDPDTKTYRDGDGNRLSQATLTEVRDAYLTGASEIVADYAANLESGAWTVQQFEQAMRTRLKNAYVAEYVLGRGGAAQMTQADYGRLGQLLRRQYGYLRRFLDDVSAGQETAGTAAERARNFLGSARQAFSRGRGIGFGVTLPYHPGDGGTPCHGRCRCHWEIEEDDDEIRAFWRTGSVKTCTGCVDRASESSPLIIPRLIA